MTDNRFLIILIISLLLSACASPGFMSGFSAGKQKNSLPFMEKDFIEDVHSVAIPPFYGDRYNWKGVAHEILASSSRISVIPQEKISRTIKEGGKYLSVLKLEVRLESLSRLGKALQSDAILNGIILSDGEEHELILQLISSKDNRVIWWQAVDFHFKEGSLYRNDQKALLSKMLAPLLAHLGKSKKSKSQPKTDEQPKTDTQPKIDKKPADISPM